MIRSQTKWAGGIKWRSFAACNSIKKTWVDVRTGEEPLSDLFSKKIVLKCGGGGVVSYL